MNVEDKVTAALSVSGPATGPATAEHRKAGHAGRVVLLWSGIFLGITILSYAIETHTAFWWAPAGICVALFVVGLMLTFESERQRQTRETVDGRSVVRDTRYPPTLAP